MNTYSLKMSELRFVALILVVLAFVATPHLIEACRMAGAAQVVGDFNVVIRASMECYADTQEYPPSSQWGMVPADFSPYLPIGFSFQRKGITYRWRRWCLPTGLPRKPNQTVLVGLQIKTEDPSLLNSIVRVYKGRIAQLTDNQVTFVIL